MRDELLKESALGRMAKEVMDSEAFGAACEKIEKEIYGAWQKADDPAIRESLWCELKGLKSILVKLKSMMEDGQIADRRLSGQK